VSRRNLPTEFQRATLDQNSLDPRDLSAPQATFGQSSGAGTSTRALPSLAVRLGLSFLIIGHLWGVIGRPLEFATQGPFGPSPSMTLLRRPVRGYGEFMYLDHGYAFFAPEPGPSHLIRATVVPPGGQSLEQGSEQGAAQKEAAPPVEGDAGVVRFFPDRVDQWPRLLYHRHFMLAEFLNTVYHPPGEPPLEIRNDAVASRDWRMSRARYEAVRDSIVRCLNKKYPGMGVTVDRIEHRQPGLPEFMRDGVKLDAPQLYLVLEDVAPQPSVPGPGPAETLPLGGAVQGGGAPQGSGAVQGGGAPQGSGAVQGQPQGTPPGPSDVESQPKTGVSPSDDPSEPALNSPLNGPTARASGSSGGRGSSGGSSGGRGDNALSIARWRRISATWEVRS
jgi:hypothetical protein